MNNKGVTLIELLIVIVVLGIIAAFAVPAVGDIIDNTQEEAVLVDARAIADQARLYCGAGNCSSAEEATGLTFDDLTLDVFDGSKYEETDSDDTGSTNTTVIVKKVGGVWVVQLTPEDTTGSYGFGGVEATPAFVDPVTADKDDVYPAS